METKRLARYLNSVGKECFVTYFEMFNDSNIPNQKIAEKISDEKGYTDKACASRTGHARMIVREGGAVEALKIITESIRLDIAIIRKAENHSQNIT